MRKECLPPALAARGTLNTTRAPTPWDQDVRQASQTAPIAFARSYQSSTLTGAYAASDQLSPGYCSTPAVHNQNIGEKSPCTSNTSRALGRRLLPSKAYRSVHRLTSSRKPTLNTYHTGVTRVCTFAAHSSRPGLLATMSPTTYAWSHIRPNHLRPFQRVVRFRAMAHTPSRLIPTPRHASTAYAVTPPGRSSRSARAL